MTDPNDGQYEAADNEPTHEDDVTPAEEAPPTDDSVGDEEPAATGSDERPAGPPIEPEAAAELAQEITLVTRALFAQMLPATSRNAISGLPGHQVPAAGTTAPTVSGAVETPAPAPDPNPQPPPLQVPPPAAPVESPAEAIQSDSPETTPTGNPQTPPGIAPPPLPVPGTTPGVTPGLAGPPPASEAPARTAASERSSPAAPAPAAQGLPVPGLGTPGAQPAPAATAPQSPPTTPSIPVPNLGATPAPTDDPGPQDDTNDEPEQPTPKPTRRRSLAVLDEVAFLDE